MLMILIVFIVVEKEWTGCCFQYSSCAGLDMWLKTPVTDAYNAMMIVS